jgi:hypothetical protein
MWASRAPGSLEVECHLVCDTGGTKLMWLANALRFPRGQGTGGAGSITTPIVQNIWVPGGGTSLQLSHEEKSATEIRFWGD